MAENDNKKFDFELVSPEQKLISEPARMVVIPGEEGDFGVMADHMSLVATVKTGVVKVFTGDTDEADREIFITGGFADVSADNCTLLAEEAVNVEDLDPDELAQQEKTLQARLNQAEDVAGKRSLRRSLDLVKAKLAVARGPVGEAA